MIDRRLAVPILLASLWLSACRRDPPPEPAVPSGPTAEQLEAQRVADSIARARADSIARAQADAARLAAERERALAAARATLEEMVFFDYDRSELRSDAESVLRQKVEILQRSPAIQLRIEGHADERGSTEYNVALGTRRAESVRQFFVGFGLSADRFAIFSYGEERPLVNQSNESAWARNRRAEFIITAGANQIVP
jgi:peptidoglycan-associated lipoprotein